MTAPVYLDTDPTRAYGRNRGFTLASIGVLPALPSSAAAVELQFFGKKGSINAEVELSRDDAARLVRQITDILENR